jgi:hypothetical protein
MSIVEVGVNMIQKAVSNASSLAEDALIKRRINTFIFSKRQLHLHPGKCEAMSLALPKRD